MGRIPSLPCAAPVTSGGGGGRGGEGRGWRACADDLAEGCQEEERIYAQRKQIIKHNAHLKSCSFRH